MLQNNRHLPYLTHPMTPRDGLDKKYVAEFLLMRNQGVERLINASFCGREWQN